MFGAYRPTLFRRKGQDVLWEVSGTDQETGDQQTLAIEADDEASATRRATRQGLAVAW